jgi:hypothetical protein
MILIFEYYLIYANEGIISTKKKNTKWKRKKKSE